MQIGREQQLGGNAPVHHVIDGAIGLVAAVAARRSIALRFAAAPGELCVKGDTVQLQQVILNLIINAMDAISEAEVRVREVSVSMGASSSHAEIRVGDTGPGIAAGDLKSVFDSFFTTKQNGMGMGLAIVRTIVEAHHGHVSAENQTAGGALFTIRIPMARGRSHAR